MPYRSPARFLAPVALLAAVLTVFLVTRSELGGSEGSSSSGTSSTKTSTSRERTTSTARSTTTAAAKKPPARTYTVKAGNNPGSIAEETGVALADLLEYNDIDAQSLRVGQKLKLTP